MEEIWNKILNLKKEVDSVIAEQFSSVQFFVSEEEDEVLINTKLDVSAFKSVYISKDIDFDTPNEISSFALIDVWNVHFLNTTQWSVDEINFLKLYLPYCLSSIIANQQQKSFVVSHFAQTLDGKIATHLGSSKWIGNQENLIHSHRMRALCAGIMVGAKTYEVDAPQLTVRLVEGSNPIKIVVSKNNQLRTSLNDDILWISDGVDVRDDGILNCEQIVKDLFAKGIYSVYLEGGAHTTSQFLATKNINVLQLHISPIILGSGINNFSLFPVNEISEGIKFTNYQYFIIGSELMFVGEFFKPNQV
jgi:diaminohydroxyphosphoribosylaminopyrimidine deaminase/5-amino-6-(5-phosphoribosylamino)uracil reductase